MDIIAVASSSSEYLRQFERLLAELSARFVNLPAARIDAAINDALRRIVELAGGDRCQLIRLSAGGDEAHVTHSWAVEGVAPVLPRPLASAFPWVLARIRAGHSVVAQRIDDLPPEAAVDRASWQVAGVRSNLTMPMAVGGRVEGCIALGCLRRERAWSDSLVERIRDLADVFANALAHKRAQEALDAAMGFERMLSNVLAALLTAGRAEQDRVIETGLGDMARALGTGRATLWQRIGDDIAFTKTHRGLADGAPAPQEPSGKAAIPWIGAQLAGGAVVRFSRHADLPPDAAADLPALRALEIRAAVFVPLAVSGAVVGALSFVAARAEQEWPDALLPRVRLLGEVFASVLARTAAERREQEAQAQAAHAARVGTMGLVAASLVHELTQPLAASLANAETASELLEARAPDLDELRATVADIVADDRRAGELIQHLRRFLRRGEVERTEVDLRGVADEVLRLVGNDAADKGIDVAVDFAAALPRVVGDRVQLQQVLLNLVLNAMDAVAANAPGARRVEVTARPAQAGVCLEVIDTGAGMDEATIARVFQPFFTTKAGGMGLGLSISQTIVAAHGGRLAVRSAVGRGTTFRVDLPVRPPQAKDAARVVSAPASAGGTVFLIDDDVSIRRAVNRQLQSAGYRVESFGSAQAFLEHSAPDGVGCIVSDVRMPGLSGLDLQASLVAAGRDLPIVFISGHGDVAITAHAMKAGAVNFLAKPFTRAELVAAVAEALARSMDSTRSRSERAELQSRYDALTPREREVLALVAAGLLNKVIADRLGAAEKTVKIHRGRVMEKMRAGSVAELVRMVERLGLPPAREAAGG